jgi:hypothetical protein
VLDGSGSDGQISQMWWFLKLSVLNTKLPQCPIAKENIIDTPNNGGYITLSDYEHFRYTNPYMTISYKALYAQKGDSEGFVDFTSLVAKLPLNVYLVLVLTFFVLVHGMLGWNWNLKFFWISKTSLIKFLAT